MTSFEKHPNDSFIRQAIIFRRPVRPLVLIGRDTMLEHPIRTRGLNTSVVINFFSFCSVTCLFSPESRAFSI
jgi:hypothetical protein